MTDVKTRMWISKEKSSCCGKLIVVTAKDGTETRTCPSCRKVLSVFTPWETAHLMVEKLANDRSEKLARIQHIYGGTKV